MDLWKKDMKGYESRETKKYVELQKYNRLWGKFTKQPTISVVILFSPYSSELP